MCLLDDFSGFDFFFFLLCSTCWIVWCQGFCSLCFVWRRVWTEKKQSSLIWGKKRKCRHCKSQKSQFPFLLFFSYTIERVFYLHSRWPDFCSVSELFWIGLLMSASLTMKLLLDLIGIPVLWLWVPVIWLSLIYFFFLVVRFWGCFFFLHFSIWKRELVGVRTDACFEKKDNHKKIE